MTTKLELSVILTTFERPNHLERSLASLVLQRGVAGKFEVIVTDDGSRDRTPKVVGNFARAVDFPVTFVTHPHRGFRVSLCRNDGVRASSAPYLLFSDGDCIFPPDHLQKHLMAQRSMIVRAGGCFCLDEASTEKVDAAAIASGAYRSLVPRFERQRLFQKWIKEQCYLFVRHPAKPKLTGCNIGISRQDLERVNGFDETFVGWGCEDDDLAFRLRKAGVRVASALGYTYAYHMWHPVDPSRPQKWNEGLNVKRLYHLDRPIQCDVGLVRNIKVADGAHEPIDEDTQQIANRQYRRAA